MDDVAADAHMRSDRHAHSISGGGNALIGALVVKSDRYDLSPDSQGPLIEGVARILGEALGR